MITETVNMMEQIEGKLSVFILLITVTTTVPTTAVTYRMVSTEMHDANSFKWVSGIIPISWRRRLRSRQLA